MKKLEIKDSQVSVVDDAAGTHCGPFHNISQCRCIRGIDPANRCRFNFLGGGVALSSHFFHCTNGDGAGDAVKSHYPERGAGLFVDLAIGADYADKCLP